MAAPEATASAAAANSGRASQLRSLNRMMILLVPEMRRHRRRTPAVASLRLDPNLAIFIPGGSSSGRPS
jgi:hypothetical protein